MRQIKILGPGCRRCDQLAAATKEAADQLGIDYELEKVTDVAKFVDYGVMIEHVPTGFTIGGGSSTQAKGRLGHFFLQDPGYAVHIVNQRLGDVIAREPAEVIPVAELKLQFRGV